MGKWYKEFQALIWAASLAVGVLMWTITTLATKEYVDTKHESAVSILHEIRDDVKEIRRDIYKVKR